MRVFHPDYFFERSMPEPNTGCWIWMKATSWSGYGVVNVGAGGKTSRAHRMSYITATGRELTSSTDVCHRCDNRLCVNPAHLFEGSRKDNMRDCADKGRIRTPILTGDASPNSKLTSQQVRLIRADDRSQRAIARDYGVDKGTISAIKRRKTWRDVA